MNIGDKKHPICIRVNDEMYEWLKTQTQEMGLKSLGEYVRIVLRVGMVTSKNIGNTCGQVFSVLSEELPSIENLKEAKEVVK